MRITVKLVGGARGALSEQHLGPAGASYLAPDGTRVTDLLADLPIPETSVWSFFVNGRHAERDQVLQEGDELILFPAVGGGQ
jgi:sulfur carrier protein ThiS